MRFLPAPLVKSLYAMTKQLQRTFASPKGGIALLDRRSITSPSGSPRWEKMVRPAVFWEIYEKESWVYAAVQEIKKWVLADGWEIMPVVENPDTEQKARVERFLESPNPDETFEDLLESSVIDLMVFGDAFWEIARVDGKPEMGALFSMDTVRMQIEADDNGNITQYVQVGVNGGAKEVTIEKKDVIHFKLAARGRNLFGRSPLNSLLIPVETDLWAQIWNREFFKNFATPSHAFMVDEGVSDDQFEKIRAALTEFKGAANAHHNLVLHGGVKFEKLSTDPKEMSFIELRKFNREEILGAYGVPPSMVGVVEVGNLGGNSSESQMEKFFEGTIAPIQRKLMAQINRRIIKRELLVTDYVLKFREDDPPVDLDRARAEEIYVRSGIKTKNESRKRLGLPPLRGADDLTIETPTEAVSGQPSTEEALQTDLGDGQEQPILSLDGKEDRAPIKSPGRMTPGVDAAIMKLETMLLSLMSRWRLRVLNRLRRYEKAVISADDLTEELDPGEARVMMSAVLATASKAALKQARNAGGADVDLMFSLIRPEIEESATRISLDLTDSVKRQIGDVVLQSTREGDSIEMLRQKLDNWFDSPLVVAVAPGLDDEGNVIRQPYERSLEARDWARMVARTEAMGAANSASLRSYKRAGIKRVRWVTAKDLRVDAKICLPNDGEEFDIDEAIAKKILPAHPNCRCRWAPVRT